MVSIVVGSFKLSLIALNQAVSHGRPAKFTNILDMHLIDAYFDVVSPFVRVKHTIKELKRFTVELQSNSM